MVDALPGQNAAGSDRVQIADDPRRTRSSLFQDSFATSSALGENIQVLPHHKYARIERERRFLIDQFPRDANVIRIRRITDDYIDGTVLRLRELSDDGCETIFKLTLKVPERASGAQQGFVTSMYLTKKEFSVLAQLSARAHQDSLQRATFRH